MASDDRTDNVKLLLGQAVGLSLYIEPSKVQEELKFYEEIRAITVMQSVQGGLFTGQTIVGDAH